LYELHRDWQTSRPQGLWSLAPPVLAASTATARLSVGLSMSVCLSVCLCRGVSGHGRYVAYPFIAALYKSTTVDPRQCPARRYVAAVPRPLAGPDGKVASPGLSTWSIERRNAPIPAFHWLPFAMNAVAHSDATVV